MLGLRDVGAAVLTVIDTLTSPGRFSRECVNDLHENVNINYTVISNNLWERENTLVATAMLKKCTNPMFLSRTILT